MSSEAKDDVDCGIDLSHPIACGNLLHVGWLELQSKYLKSWNNRYIILFMDKCIINIYKTKPKNINSIEQIEPADTFILAHITKLKSIDSNNHFIFEISMNQKDNKNKQYSFKTWHYSNPAVIIENKYSKTDVVKVLTFRCKSKESFKAWSELINDCIIRSKYSYILQNTTINKTNDDIKSIQVLTEIYQQLLLFKHNKNNIFYLKNLRYLYTLDTNKNLTEFNICCARLHELDGDNEQILWNWVIMLKYFENNDDDEKNENENDMINKIRILIFDYMVETYNEPFNNYNNYELFFEYICLLMGSKLFDKASYLLSVALSKHSNNEEMITFYNQFRKPLELESIDEFIDNKQDKMSKNVFEITMNESNCIICRYWIDINIFRSVHTKKSILYAYNAYKHIINECKLYVEKHKKSSVYLTDDNDKKQNEESLIKLMKWFDDTLEKAEQLTIQNHPLYLQEYITRSWMIERGCGVQIFYFIYDYYYKHNGNKFNKSLSKISSIIKLPLGIACGIIGDLFTVNLQASQIQINARKAIPFDIKDKTVNLNTMYNVKDNINVQSALFQAGQGAAFVAMM